MNNTIIVAHYKDDISWTSEYSNLVLLQKGVYIDNLGREPSTYVKYIVSNYDKLIGSYLFLQGNPLDHIDNSQIVFTKLPFYWLPTKNRTNLVCTMNGNPHDNVDIRKFLSDIGIPYDKNEIMFNGCCLFEVTADRIKERPKEFYEKLLEVLMRDEKACYAFERCVKLIFGGENE